MVFYNHNSHICIYTSNWTFQMVLFRALERKHTYVAAVRHRICFIEASKQKLHCTTRQPSTLPTTSAMLIQCHLRAHLPHPNLMLIQCVPHCQHTVLQLASTQCGGPAYIPRAIINLLQHHPQLSVMLVQYVPP